MQCNLKMWCIFQQDTWSYCVTLTVITAEVEQVYSRALTFGEKNTDELKSRQVDVAGCSEQDVVGKNTNHSKENGSKVDEIGK